MVWERRGVDRIALVAARIGVRATLGPPPRILAGWVDGEGMRVVGGVVGSAVGGIGDSVVVVVGDSVSGGVGEAGGVGEVDREGARKGDPEGVRKEAVRGFLVGLAVEL